MTTYAITSGESGMFYVVQTFEHGHTTHQDVTHGPYKNDESAKRRIRDLRRKEISAGVHGNLVTPSVETGTGKNNITNAEKLAMSSEYGKSKPFTITPATGMQKITRHMILTPVSAIPRQVGCYPAISKHAYLR